MLTLLSCVGVTERFSAHRQKLHVALLFRIHRALDPTPPAMATSSGDFPNPVT